MNMSLEWKRNKGRACKTLETYKSARFFHWSSSCPAIGAAVASTKFPSQLSTHLTRVVFIYIPFLPVKG
jgi:hypothetical protein